MMLAAPHKLWLIDGIKHKQELISFRCLRSTTEISIEWDKYATVQERAMVFAEARWVMRGRYNMVRVASQRFWCIRNWC
jgi:hypothetical protein